MKYVLITKDEELVEQSKKAFQSDDVVEIYSDWKQALECSADADLIFVDLICTLEEPHKIAGYEKFAQAKLSHAEVKKVPTVLISPPADYELDFMAGFPDLVFAYLRRPMSEKLFRRASTWI